MSGNPLDFCEHGNGGLEKPSRKARRGFWIPAVGICLLLQVNRGDDAKRGG